MKNNDVSVKSRLIEFEKYTQFSRRKFQETIGVSNGYLDKLVSCPSSKVLSRIYLRYPELNSTWLMTGEGNMIKRKNVMFEGTPLINLDGVNGMHSINDVIDSPEYVERYIPIIDSKPGDIAMHSSGDSMYPNIKSGSILHVRQIKDWQSYFGYGDVFVIVLNDGRRITKQILKSKDKENFVVYHSFNEKYDDEELPKDMIVSVWRVLHVLTEL